MSVCGQGHPLLQTEPTELSKTSWQYSSYGYRCKKCNKSERQKYSWHCKICYYDLCESCHIDGSNISLMCNTLQHPLTPFYASHSSYTCDSCKKKPSKNSLLYGCRNCNYDVCEKCYEKIQPNKDSKDKITKIFNKEYADEKDSDIMSESGTIKFFKDVGVNPESHEPLIVAYHLQSDEMGVFSKECFVNGYWKSGIKDKKQMKKVTQNVVKSVQSNNDQFKKFYKWIFDHAKEDKKKKTIPTELATQLWGILFAGKKKNGMKYFDEWIDYCDEQGEEEMPAISKDLWIQIVEFLKSTNSLDDYDDMYGWPVEIDEFVEWVKEKKK